jgi:Pyruvate/2-oxoacid:ferredoxin oxidoreductase gamma subunit
MPKNDLVIRVAGEAGEGVLSTGQLLVQGAARAGYRVLTDFSPPAEIKGGYSFFQIRIGSRPFYSRGDSVDLLLAFNREAYDLSSGDLTEGGLLIYDPAEVSPPESPTRTQYPVPLSEIARTQLKFELGKNVVAVGVLAALFGMPEEYLRKLLEQRFGARGPDILNKNLGALEAGLRYVREHIINRLPPRPVRGRAQPSRQPPHRGLGQPGGESRRADRGRAVFRWLPDHPSQRHHGVPRRRAAQGGRRRDPGRGRDRLDEHGAGRLVRRQAGHDLDQRPGRELDGRGAGPGLDG